MKKNKLTRLLALLLSCIMILQVAACGGNTQKEQNDSSKGNEEQDSETDDGQGSETDDGQGSETDDGTIPVDKFAGTELTIAVIKDGIDLSDSFDDKKIVKMAEEATGIHINWIEIDAAAASERLDTMLFSDEQPDCYLGLLDNTTLVANKDLFYNLAEGDLLETYAPNVLADYEEGGQGMLNMLTLSDGSIRSLAGNMGTDITSNIGVAWYINKAWLDQLGMGVPTTAEEFYNVLCAFRDNDMNGNGDATDEIPMSFCEARSFGVIHLANAFGITGIDWENDRHYFRIRDGVVESVVDKDNYRAYLEYMNKLASEGLIDIEGFSQTNEQYHAKLAAGTVGFFLGWDPTTEGVANPEDYVGMIPFTALDDVEIKKSSHLDKSYARLASFVPTADTENIEALLHWWNWLSSSKENKYLCRFGSYFYDENGECQPNWTEEMAEELLAPYDGDGTAFQYSEGIGNVTAPYLGRQDWYPELSPDYVRHAIHIECAEKDMLLKGLGVEVIQNRLSDPEIVEERTFMEIDLLPLIDGFMANSIVKGVTDDSWNQFLSDLEKYGYYDWLDWWQGFVNFEY